MCRTLYALLLLSILYLHVDAGVVNCDRPHWMPCDNGRCISSLFECDGENDCGDNSDEKNCKDFKLVLHLACTTDEYQCNDRSCIPIEKFCDLKNDCPDASDEHDGCVKELKCDAFRCNDGHCVKNEWVCDGVPDCPDKSDETNCANRTISIDECNNGNDRYLCKNKRCIFLSATCNKKDDCGDGSDEDTDGCAKAEQLCTKTARCDQFCRRTPEGPACSCQPGYKLQDNRTCIDINECDIYGSCDQKCINSAGSYVCACQNGYNLQDDKKTCKADGGEALMIFSVKTEIRGLYLNSEVYFSVAKNLQHVIGVSLDSNYIYWSDIKDGDEAIIRSLEDGTHQEVIVTTGLGTPDIAVDWITGNIYFSDSTFMHIGVCANDGSYCTVILKDRSDKPRDLALLPANGIMYWSVWGTQPRIMMSGMDGNESRTFIGEKLGWPNGLAIDYANNRLYWIDAKLKVIESVRLDGSDRRTVLREVAKEPFSLAVFENKLYWSDWASSTIQSCNKFTGKNWNILVRENSTIYGLHVYHSVLKPKMPNPCNSRPCSQLCLLNQHSGYSCACTMDKELNSDRHTCRGIKKKEHLVIAAGNTFIDYYHELLGKPKMTASITLKHVTALTYNSITGGVLASDQLTDSIFHFDTKSGELKSIMNLRNEILGGMAFDYIGNNLYLSDIEHNTIEVYNLANGEKTVFYFKEEPRDLTVIPELGIMFVVFHMQDKYFIDKLQMNGIGPRMRIAENGLSGPKISLCYDKELNRIFWSDQGTGRIESSTIEGHDTYLFRTGLSEPVSLAILGERIFWTQHKSNKLYWANKNNTNQYQKRIALFVPADLDILHIVALHGPYVNDKHECRRNNGNCSHVCLVSNTQSYICACPPDMTLNTDNQTCIPQTACDKGEIKCGTHDVCVKLQQRCDGKQDCPNGEDEFNCGNLYSCEEDQFQCKSGMCISSKQRCNSIYDCTDRSDEDGCDKKDCQNNEFQCHEGTCISNSLICDGQNDCPDFSDEINCATHTCDSEHFICDMGKCMSKAWECDGQVDCLDGSDEGEKCRSQTCPSEMYTCNNGRCIDAILKCNGFDDCGDDSDEGYCTNGNDVNSANCTQEEYRCYNTKLCLPKRARCNGIQDCPKNDDEHNCALCNEGEFVCDNQRCITLNWVCDMADDCGDKSDEKDCGGDNSRRNSISKFSHCEEFRCENGACLPFEKVCDGISHCSDGSDELGKCGISCMQNNPCQYVCHKTPSGPACGCQSGYRLAADSKSCEDINECDKNVCSQICRNTIGSFICSCYDGYVLRSDRKSCKVAGPQMEIITVVRSGIRKLSQTLSTIEVVHEEFNFDVTDIDVNAKAETVYWSNDELSMIGKIHVKNKDQKTVTGIGRPEALAVDWVTDNVYFNDNNRPVSIKVCNLEQQKCAKVVAIEGRSKAMAIAVDPIHGWLFWSQTNWELYNDISSEIYRSDMTGSNMTAIVYRNLGVVTAITIDHIRSRLYWTDTYYKTIQVSDFDGTNRETFLETRIYQPLKINVYEDNLYWLMGMTGQLQKCKLHGDRSCTTISIGTSNIGKHFAILHTSRQPPKENSCEDRKCDYMCIIRNADTECICENGNPSGLGNSCAQSTNKLTKFATTIAKRRNENVRQKSAVFIAITVTVVTGIVILSGYYYYQKIKPNLPKANGLSIHFQNPSYGRRNEVVTPLNCISGLPPGEHEYINPLMNITKKQEKDEKERLDVAQSDQSDVESEYTGSKQNTRLIR